MGWDPGAKAKGAFPGKGSCKGPLTEKGRIAFGAGLRRDIEGVKYGF